MISATKVAAPAILMPSIRSLASMSRRAAHWVHTVTVPAARTPASRSASGAACGSEKSSARPGRPNQADSPVSHSETETPLATAAAATVKAWLQRSGSSLPAVTLMTSERSGMAETLVVRARPGTGAAGSGRARLKARSPQGAPGYGVPCRGAGGAPIDLRAMHGMLSAAILIGVFAVVAAACLYLVVRVFAAGRGHTRGQAQGQAHGHALGQEGHGGDAI